MRPHDAHYRVKPIGPKVQATQQRDDDEHRCRSVRHDMQVGGSLVEIVTVFVIMGMSMAGIGVTVVMVVMIMLVSQPSGA